MWKHESELVWLDEQGGYFKSYCKHCHIEGAYWSALTKEFYEKRNRPLPACYVEEEED